MPGCNGIVTGTFKPARSLFPVRQPTNPSGNRRAGSHTPGSRHVRSRQQASSGGAREATNIDFVTRSARPGLVFKEGIRPAATRQDRELTRANAPVASTKGWLHDYLSLIAGILILVVPRLLNCIVAVYLIVIGVMGLAGAGNFHF